MRVVGCSRLLDACSYTMVGQAFAFKELVQVQCPICHDHSEVPLYY